MSVPDDGFVSRWARRKALARSGVAPAEKPAPGPADGAVAKAEPGAVVAVAPAAGSVQLPTPASVGQPPVLPTMADVARLTRNSDFASFVGPGVDPGVSNAAMKKLFSDPRYNVMDGLDTYIGDYNTPDPIPLAMLRQMNQSAFLGLFDHEIEAEQKVVDEQRLDQADSADAVGSEARAPAASLPMPEPAGMHAPVATSRIRIDDDTDL